MLHVPKGLVPRPFCFGGEYFRELPNPVMPPSRSANRIKHFVDIGFINANVAAGKGGLWRRK
jgi:hypothetical protein